ncbi:MAG: NRDE family protein [Alphaproteobacteria bacterium]|jgi:uncharacterized protein with NRDE domain|nr:NRDE family protein [Alphaproteobacteria bacterium]
MCTLVLLHRPDDDWPLIVAANRDEMEDRPWSPPGRHWPDRPDVVAGQDLEAGGSWLGVNDHGLLAGILNRPGALGPAPGMRTRGELVLEALDHAEAKAAAEALGDLDGRAWRPFNLVVADAGDAFWVRHDGSGEVAVAPLPQGLSMVTSHDPNDRRSTRVDAYLDRFADADTPRPDAADWTAWQRLMADTGPAAQPDPLSAMCVITNRGFATVSSSLIALAPATGLRATWHWRFAPGRPDQTSYEDITFQ